MDNMQSSELVTEKKYPISKLWIFKGPITYIFISILSIMFIIFDETNNSADGMNAYLLFIAVLLPYILIVNFLIRLNFHYSLEDKTFFVKQGVLSKKQTHLSYGVIQNVFLQQDLLDRLFGLASLRVENAVSSRSQGAKVFGIMISNKDDGKELVGSSGNKVNIPGLKKQDAEELKNLILQKIKENPINDSQSGL